MKIDRNRQKPTKPTKPTENNIAPQKKIYPKKIPPSEPKNSPGGFFRIAAPAFVSG
jgi:hypothetical protein